MRIIACFIILCSFHNSLMAQNPNQPVYAVSVLDGSAPVVIDGDLADWADIDAPWTPIATAQHLPDYTVADPFGNRNWQGPADLAARFRTCADDVYLYAAVDVTDDRYVRRPAGKFNTGEDGDMIVVTFRKLLSGKPWNEQYPGDLAIGERAGGGVTLEGRCPPYFWDPLYGWDALGAAAAISRESHGYTVEVKIPLAAMGLMNAADMDRLSFDVRVCDADGGQAGDNALCWSNDREWQNRETTSGRLVFQKAPGGVGSMAKRGFAAPVPATVRMDAEKGMVITLPEPSRQGPAVIPNVTTAPVAELQQRLADVKNDKTADARLTIGAAGLVAGRAAFDSNWDGAIEALKDLDPLVENSTVAHRWLIKSRLIYQGKSANPPDAATIESYVTVLSADDVNEILRQAGNGNTTHQRYEQAIECHRRLYERATHPRSRAFALYDMGFAAKKLQRWDEAIEYFRRLASMTEPEVPHLRKTAVGMYELGNAWMKKKDFAKAAEVWESLLERYRATDILYDHNGRVDRQPCWFLPAARYYSAEAYKQMGNVEKAILIWQALLEDDRVPEQLVEKMWWLHASTYSRLGRTEYALGNLVQAREYFQKMREQLNLHKDEIPRIEDITSSGVR